MRFCSCNHGLPIISVTAIFAIHREQEHEQEPRKSWILFADQLTPNKLIIRQPFSKGCYSMPLNFPNYLDVPNIRVHEVARFYNLSFHTVVNQPPVMWSKYNHKVVLNADETAAFALFSNGKLGMCEFRLSHFWAGIKLSPVNSIAGDEDSRFDDVVCYKGRILGVDRIARLYDVGDVVDETREIVPYIAGCGTERKRLVESKGHLYLVDRCNVVEETDDKSIKFKVYQLNEKVDHWVVVDSCLGDRVFFFGLDFSFSASAQEMGGSFAENCILFRRGSFKNIKRDNEGVWDDDKGDNDDDLRWDYDISVWHMNDPSHVGGIRSCPGYADVLWPPPAWIWPKDLSKRLGDVEAALSSLVNIPDQNLMKALDYNLKELSQESSPLEPAFGLCTDDLKQQDTSEIWRRAHTLTRFIDDAIEVYKRFMNVKTNAMSSRQLHNIAVDMKRQVKLSTDTNEMLHSLLADSRKISTSDHSPSDDNLHALMLGLEESTRKLMDAMKLQLMLHDQLKVLWKSL